MPVTGDQWTLQRKSYSCPAICFSFRPSVTPWHVNSRFVIISQRDSILSFSLYGLVPSACPNLRLTSEIMNLYISHSTLWTADRPFARHLPTYDNTNPEKKTDCSMLQVVYKFTVPMSDCLSPCISIMIIFGKEYKQCRSLLCSFLEPHIISVQIFSSTTCSQIPSVCVLLMRETKCRNHIKLQAK
jgi:hypothetical protein